MLFLFCIEMLDGHESLTMFLVVAFNLVDLHQPRLNIFLHYR